MDKFWKGLIKSIFYIFLAFFVAMVGVTILPLMVKINPESSAAFYFSITIIVITTGFVFLSLEHWKSCLILTKKEKNAK